MKELSGEHDRRLQQVHVGGPSMEEAFVFQVPCYFRSFYRKSELISRVTTNMKAAMGHEITVPFSW